jgi:hypothetical protein
MAFAAAPDPGSDCKPNTLAPPPAPTATPQIAMLGGKTAATADGGGAAAAPAGPRAPPGAAGPPGAARPGAAAATKAMPVTDFLDKGLGGAKLPRKKQDRAEKERAKRAKGQSTHSEWKSEAFMVLRWVALGLGGGGGGGRKAFRCCGRWCWGWGGPLGLGGWWGGVVHGAARRWGQRTLFNAAAFLPTCAQARLRLARLAPAAAAAAWARARAPRPPPPTPARRRRARGAARVQE